MIGQPLPAAGAGVGTAQLPERLSCLNPNLWPAVGYECDVADGLLDASSARRGLAAPACARPAVALPARSRLYAAATRRRREGRAAPRLEAPHMLPYYYPSLPISYPRVSTMRSGSADEPPSEK